VNKKRRSNIGDRKGSFIKKAYLYHILSSIFVMLFSSPLWAVGGMNGQTTASASISEPVAFDQSRISAMLGGEMWRMAGANQFFPAVGIRYRTDWSVLPMVEVAGTIPTTFPSDFHQVSENFGPGETIQTQIASGGEAHVAGVWPFFRNEYATPQLSAGVSVASLKNALVFQDGSTRHEVNTTVSPFAELGGEVPINRSFSAYAGLGWRHYSNTVTDAGGDSFNLFVSAFTIRAMIEVQL
jgi:hypothetical protein